MKKNRKATKETKYLLSQPGLLKSIKDGENEDPSKMKKYYPGEKW